MSKIKFEVCGLQFKHFVPFFILVMLATYLGFMPTVTLAEGLTATTFIATFAFLMAVGGIFFWLGDTIPIVNKYLGGACVLPLFGASAMTLCGLVPDTLQNGVKVLMNGGFQDAYIACLLVGAVLIMDRKILLSATARYLPAIIGSQVFALGFCVLGGLVTGYGPVEALFNVGAPTMSGGSAGAMTTIPALYTSLSGTDMTGMAGQFLCYASIANVIAVMMAAIGKAVCEKKAGLVSPDSDPTILRRSGVTMVAQAEKKLPATTDNYKHLGGGIFMCFAIYMAGDMLGKLPGLSVIAGLAWSIIIAIVIKATGILDDTIGNYCANAMNFMIRALLPTLIAGIGIKSMNLTDLTSYFSVPALITIFLGVLGAFLGAMLFGHLFGLYAFETGVTAGLCCCNIGGSGDIAVLSACNRMELLAFASISTRIGGALMVVWIGVLSLPFQN